MSKQSDNIFRNSIIASGVSAIITKTSVAPLERIKLLKQSQTYYNQTRYTSLFKSCQYILKNDGFKGLYRGNVSNLYRVLPAYLIKFPLNEFYKKQLGATTNTPTLLLGSGVLAGLSQITCTYPLDIIRTRMTLDNHMTTNYNNYFTCTRNVLRNEGLSAFYKGFPVSGISYPIYVGLQFFIYEWFKDTYSYFAGGIAGIIAQSLMYPGDTIKRQLQLNGIRS